MDRKEFHWGLITHQIDYEKSVKKVGLPSQNKENMNPSQSASSLYQETYLTELQQDVICHITTQFSPR